MFSKNADAMRFESYLRSKQKYKKYFLPAMASAATAAGFEAASMLVAILNHSQQSLLHDQTGIQH